MDKIKLKPCPWCGGEAEMVCLVGPFKANYYHVRCVDAMCQGYGDWEHGGKRLAAEYWNTRHEG